MKYIKNILYWCKLICIAAFDYFKCIFVWSTPSLRFAGAFWLGWAFHLCIGAMMQDYHGKEEYLRIVDENWMNIHWAFWLVPVVIILGMFIRNRMRFEKEMLWMTIKNPAKVTREEGDLTFPNRPIAPPPPGCKPPPPPNPPKPTIPPNRNL